MPQPPTDGAAPPARRWPARPFPGYRHRPGTTPHPRTAPAGHSHGRPEPQALSLDEAGWRDHEAWLFGIDLFDHGYWWEAHEWWEAAWRVTDDAGLRHLLQGMIQLAAACLKHEAGNERGRRGLWRRSRQHLLAAAGAAAGPRAGLDVKALLASAEPVLTGPPGAVLPPLPLAR